MDTQADLRSFPVASSVQLPDDIAWHFIGALQSNKCKMLACGFDAASQVAK